MPLLTGEAKLAKSAKHALPENRYPTLLYVLKNATDKAARIQNELNRESEALERLEAAKSDYWPTLQLNGGVQLEQINRQSAENEKRFGAAFNARVRRPIYHWGAIEAKIEQARITYQQNKLNSRSTYQSLTQKLRRDFLELILNQIKRRNAELDREIQQMRQKEKRLKYQSGELSEDQWSSIKISQKQATLSLERLKHERLATKERFRINSGVPLQQDKLPSRIESLPLKALKKWLKKQNVFGGHLYQHEAIKRLRLTLENEEQEYTRLKARTRPKLNFSSGVSQSQTNTANSNSVNTITYSGGITVNWNIFDGFETTALKTESRIKQRRLQRNIDQTRKELRNKIKTQRQELLFHIRELELHEQRHTIHKRNYKQKKKDFEEGLISDIQWKRATLDHYRKALKLMQMRSQTMLDIANYLDLLDKDPAAKLIKDNTP